MEESIKKDQERIIIREELIGDNNLIQYVYNREKDNVIVSIRYIENKSIQEHLLTTLSIHQYASELNKRIRIDDNSISLFDKNKNGYILKGTYNLQEHEYTPSETIKIDDFNKKEIGRFI